MASQTGPPLDEIQHHRPDIIAWWVNDFGGQPMDENMIHRYLAESAFFDHSTKNGLHFLQAGKNLAEFQLVQDRRCLEEDLRRHVGSEYLIVGEPVEVQTPGGKERSGIWVVRKQDRQRTRGSDGRVEDELTTLGTYYAVNENMYQAPSVGEIVGNRLVSAATNLSKFFATAANLPTFSPTAGYTYLPHQNRPSSTTSAAGTGAAAGTSLHASPSRSREPSLIPGESHSLRSGSLAPLDHPSTNPTNPDKAADARLLAQSFKHALEFAAEYTDENPLLGEPGALSFTSSLAAVKKRKQADEEAAALAAKVAAAARAVREGGVKVEREEVGTAKGGEPPAVMTAQGQVLAREREREKERRGSKLGGDRVRRKKSRANAGSMVGLGEGAAGGA